MRTILSTLLLGCLLAATDGRCDDVDADAVMEALQPYQSLVGDWQGSGRSEKTRGWDETFACGWKFSDSGRVYLHLEFDDGKGGKGRLLKEAALSYDPERSKFLFYAYPTDPKAKMLKFEGDAESETNLVLDRVDKKGDDRLDRIDIKILNDGDRIVYRLDRRIGRSRVYREEAMVALDRKGASLAGAVASGPKCIVTGGAGTMTVSFEGKTYYVCCSGCRETFLADPQKWIAKASKTD